MTRQSLSQDDALRSILVRYGLAARKSLGQHFLVSPRAVHAIVDAAMPCRGVLEIGPGPGVLTELLSERAEVVALEVDSRMIEILKKTAPRAEVMKQDVLQADLCALLQALPQPRSVVSNLPYYITGPLLTKIAEARSHFDRAVLMMQKEVAERILAPPGDSARGSLSIFLQAQFEISKVMNVPAGSFLPPPKVDSIVLILIPKQTNDGPGLFELVRVGFTQPRKTLANNLGGFKGVCREDMVAHLQSLDLDARIRPHELTMDHWRSLFLRIDG